MSQRLKKGGRQNTSAGRTGRTYTIAAIRTVATQHWSKFSTRLLAPRRVRLSCRVHNAEHDQVPHEILDWLNLQVESSYQVQQPIDRNITNSFSTAQASIVMYTIFYLHVLLSMLPLPPLPSRLDHQKFLWLCYCRGVLCAQQQDNCGNIDHAYHQISSTTTVPCIMLGFLYSLDDIQVVLLASHAGAALV